MHIESTCCAWRRGGSRLTIRCLGVITCSSEFLVITPPWRVWSGSCWGRHWLERDPSSKKITDPKKIRTIHAATAIQWTKTCHFSQNELSESVNPVYLEGMGLICDGNHAQAFGERQTLTTRRGSPLGRCARNRPGTFQGPEQLTTQAVAFVKVPHMAR